MNHVGKSRKLEDLPSGEMLLAIVLISALTLASPTASCQEEKRGRRRDQESPSGHRLLEHRVAESARHSPDQVSGVLFG